MARKGDSALAVGPWQSLGAPGSRLRAIGFWLIAKNACFQSSAQRKSAMRTAADFNLYYAVPDPWHISHARFRDKVLRRRMRPFIRGKSVLELGCGEGHLTQAIFSKARSVVGIDISDVAIARAKSLNLPNARFESADFLNAPFEGYDVIAAIECVYYLSFQEREALLEKIAKQHSGKIVLLSGPIVDYRRHFSHKRLMHEFTTLGFTPLKFYNLSIYWYPPSSRIIAHLIKLPLGYTMLDWMPESMIYQRLYAFRAPKRR
jgi:SAM-dependent methyltransferase